MPSLQRQVIPVFPSDSLRIIGINASSSVAWLSSYAPKKGISYPLVFDSGGLLHSRYEVGSAYGNIPPSFFIIDRKGIVRYRTDDKFGRTQAMIDSIRTYLAEEQTVVSASCPTGERSLR